MPAGLGREAGALGVRLEGKGERSLDVEQGEVRSRKPGDEKTQVLRAGVMGAHGSSLPNL